MSFIKKTMPKMMMTSSKMDTTTTTKTSSKMDTTTTNESSSSTTTSTFDVLKNVLDGSFDAGFIVAEDSASASAANNAADGGKIVHMNEAALDLFDLPSSLLVKPSSSSSTTTATTNANANNSNSEEKKNPSLRNYPTPKVEQFISFWSPILPDEEDDDDDDENENHDILSSEGKTTSASSRKKAAADAAAKAKETQKPDQQSWKEVITKASQQVDPIRKWRITGNVGLTNLLMGSINDDDNENDDDNNNDTIMKDEDEDDDSKNNKPPSSPKSPRKRRMTSVRTFPGTLQITPFPSSGGEKANQKILWMVFVRHADHDDIIRSGSISYTQNSGSQILRSSKRHHGHGSGGGGSKVSSKYHRYSRHNNKKKNDGTDGDDDDDANETGGPPRICIDSSGTIIDIQNIRNIESDNGIFDWVTQDLIGNHISTVNAGGDKQPPPAPAAAAAAAFPPVAAAAAAAVPPVAAAPAPEEIPKPDPNDYFAMYKYKQQQAKAQKAAEAAEAAIKQKQFEEQKAKAKALKAKQKQQRKPGQPMLEFVLENHMSAGHSSCPYSGITLQAQDYNTALTTGNAIKEENITAACLEAALDPIFQIDEHGIIQMVNSSASKTFGWTRHEFIGSNISMICGGGHGDRHASYIARYLATDTTRVIGKNRELIAKKKDGTEFPIELGVVEVDTYAGDTRLFCGFVRNLTNLKAKEKLAQEIVEIALDPMVQIDQRGTILMINKATELTFGYNREELIGENVAMICGGNHGTNHDRYLQNYLETKNPKVIGKYRELPAKHKDGNEFSIRLAVVEIPMMGQNNESTFCAFIHDMTETTIHQINKRKKLNNSSSENENSN